MSATPLQSPYLPPPLPPPMPPPRAVRRLTMENLNLPPESPPLRSPSPGRSASPVVDEAPESPIVNCSKYRPHWSLPGHEKVDGWLRDVMAAYESDGPSSYPRLPAAPRKDQYVSDTDTEYGRPRRRRRRSPPYQERGALCAQGLRGPAPAVLLCHRTPRGRPAGKRRFCVFQHPRHTVGIGHAE